MVKNLTAMQETRVRSLSQEDFLEKDMATHSKILGDSLVAHLEAQMIRIYLQCERPGLNP